MQRLLEKHGYARCGILSMKDVFGRRKTRGWPTSASCRQRRPPAPGFGRMIKNDVKGSPNLFTVVGFRGTMR